MNNKELNSRNTDNPYELISGIQLVSKENKNIKIGITATKFSYVSNRRRRRKDLIMLSFDVYNNYKIKYDEDYAVIKLFNKIRRFSKRCKNPLEVITLFIDAYKENKNKLSIRISTCPAYPDAIDAKFVYESLLK